jgi:iron complex outermembrane receptor protein
MKRIAFAGALVFCLSLFSFAQITVSGYVYDLSSDKPLSGVQVYIDRADMNNPTGTTDSLGRFSIKFNQSNVALLFQHPDYVDYETKVVAGKNKQAVSLWIGMLPEVMENEEVIVKATRAGSNSPTAFSNINKKQLTEKNFGQDFPYLLQMTPSSVVFSDAGAGIGYTGIRIRGVDPTRINVTLNGIPLNDAESQGVFWVNMPDFGSSAESVQIQRGVGTSSNGAAAFGASINVNTNHLPKKAYAAIQSGIGSFKSFQNSVQFGTGILENNWSVNGRLSKITSEGYIDRASSDLKSFFLSAGRTGKKDFFKVNIFSGIEITYQAWNGMPKPKFDGDAVALENHITNLSLSKQEAANLKNSGNTYNYFTYKNQVDNYQQDNYQLFYNYSFNKRLSLNTALHYTRGRGYYEEYKNNEEFQDYGLDTLRFDNVNITKTDLIRRRWLDNHFGGGIFSIHYEKGNLSLVWGGGYNVYLGDYFGEVIWARYMSDREIRWRYYDNDARKSEGNSYLKANWKYRKWLFFADAQFRSVDYRFVGPDNSGQELNQSVSYNFFNPKLGASFDLSNKSLLYLSVARSNKEPIRDDFVNSSPDSRPMSERLTDLEAGWRYRTKRMKAVVNGYYMIYKNQLILTGKINDVGGYTRTNVAESNRAGIETEFSWTINKWLQWSSNATISQNKVAAFTEFVDDWITYLQVLKEYKNTDLALSPNWVAASQIRFLPISHLTIDLITKSVGRQFLDNTSNITRSLEPYVVNDIVFSWKIFETGKLKDMSARKNNLFKELAISFALNNVTQTRYAPNGYTFSGIIENQRYDFNYVYPQAGFNYFFRLNAGF